MDAEQVLGSVVQGAMEFPDPVAQKMCFTILSRMIETWGEQLRAFWRNGWCHGLGPYVAE